MIGRRPETRLAIRDLMPVPGSGGVGREVYRYYINIPQMLTTRDLRISHCTEEEGMEAVEAVRRYLKYYTCCEPVRLFAVWPLVFHATEGRYRC